MVLKKSWPLLVRMRIWTWVYIVREQMVKGLGRNHLDNIREGPELRINKCMKLLTCLYMNKVFKATVNMKDFNAKL